ncbi:MAG: hypothetical protein LUB56_03125 [Coprobacillus sp.]|nr:hypothetical protein [Coprobacillus sp.]
MNIYDFMEKYQKKRNTFEKSYEYKFFIDNRYLLTKFPYFSFLFDRDYDDFDIMRANIILRSLLTKKKIEDEIWALNERYNNGEVINHQIYVKSILDVTYSLPYYLEEKNKIYLPIFNRAINSMYIHEPEKLLNEPYIHLFSDYNANIVDPFDTYGPELYNSLFTRLVLVGTNSREYAYFHYDTNTIYIVNKEGRLDNKIVLFDKYLKRVQYRDMLERIEPVMKAYFDSDMQGFYDALVDSNFLSRKALYYYLIKYKKNKK